MRALASGKDCCGTGWREVVADRFDSVSTKVDGILARPAAGDDCFPTSRPGCAYFIPTLFNQLDERRLRS